MHELIEPCSESHDRQMARRAYPEFISGVTALFFPDCHAALRASRNDDKFVQKALRIFKSARNDEEKACYLEALKAARKCFKTARSTEN